MERQERQRQAQAKSWAASKNGPATVAEKGLSFAELLAQKNTAQAAAAQAQKTVHAGKGAISSSASVGKNTTKTSAWATPNEGDEDAEYYAALEASKADAGGNYKQEEMDAWGDSWGGDHTHTGGHSKTQHKNKADNWGEDDVDAFLKEGGLKKKTSSSTSAHADAYDEWGDVVGQGGRHQKKDSKTGNGSGD